MAMKFLITLIHFSIPLFAMAFVPHHRVTSNKKYTTLPYEMQLKAFESSDKTSIAIVGSGAVGCYYGARLHETNLYNVIFFMRGDHYKVSKRCGLKVTSIDDDVFIPPDQLQAYNKIEDIGKVDWVILALKSTGISSVPELLIPLLTKDTRVIFVMNGFVDEDIVRLLEGETNENVEPTLTQCAAVYAGMALLCSNRIAPGHVDHSYAGKLSTSLVKSSSTVMSDIELNQRLIVDLWKPTKIEFRYEPIYTKARWTKNVWNLPFNGISTLNGITIDEVVNDPGLRALAYKIMDETIAIANKDIESRGYSEQDFLGETEKKEMMALSDAMGPYKTSTYLDLVNKRPLEVKYLFRKALDRAKILEVSAPILETIVTLIEAKQRRNQL